MLASIRLWRAIRATLPDDPALDDLAIRLRHEPPVARKRHMVWDVPLSSDEAAAVQRLRQQPPNPYLDFCFKHDDQDPLVLAARRG